MTFYSKVSAHLNQFSAHLAIIIATMMFSVVVLPDTHVTWPHPAFWRIILGLSFLYGLFMIYLTFLPLQEAWSFLQIYDSRLGVDLPEKSYASDCRLYTPEESNPVKNLWDNIYDVHFLAHFLGWWFKVLIIWDAKICWLCSILFELLELTFRHWLPNFYECWWDHVRWCLTIANFGRVWLQFSWNCIRSAYT